MKIDSDVLAAGFRLLTVRRSLLRSNHRGKNMNKNLLKNGFIAAGLMNIGGVLLFSRGFTNSAINNADPVVMSNFGLLMIAVWGLAYLGAPRGRSPGTSTPERGKAGVS